MADDTKKPDALLFPASWEGSLTADTRIHAIQEVAGPILGVDPMVDAKLHIRVQPAGAGTFVTLDPAATLLYPSNHRLAYRPRYNWTTRADGVQEGYLKS